MTTPAATSRRRRAWKRGSLARTAEANLGSSASDRSICSNSRCSCSESGTALLPGHIGRPGRADRPWQPTGCLPASLRGGSRVGKRDDLMVGSDFRLGAAMIACRDRLAGRYDGPPESGSRGVGRRLRLPPAALRRTQDELARRRSGRGQPLHPYADQTDRLAGSRAVAERPGGVEHLPGDVGRHDQGAGPVDRAEVGQPDLDRHRPPDLPGRRAAGRRPCRPARAGTAGSPADRPRRCRRSPRRRSTSPRCSGLTRRGSRPQDSSCRCVGGGLAERPAEQPEGRLGQVADGGQAEPAQRLGGPLPHPPQRRRPAADAGTPAPGRAGTTSRPSGLARVEPSLATNLVGATPTEQVSRCSSATRRADQPGDLGRASRTAGGRRPRRGTPRPGRAARPAG